jgi:hypothetical protein
VLLLDAIWDLPKQRVIDLSFPGQIFGVPNDQLVIVTKEPTRWFCQLSGQQ